MIIGATSGGSEPPPHIGRHSREPKFRHSLLSHRVIEKPKLSLPIVFRTQSLILFPENALVLLGHQ